MLVLLSHCFALTAGNDAAEPIRRLTRGQITGGELAVDLFFVISGFLIAQSWERSRGLIDYLRRRLLRIGPGFWVAALVCLFVVAPLGAQSPARVHDNNQLWKAIPEALVLFYVPAIPGVFVRNPVPEAIDGSLWTVKIEVGCYVLVAALGLARLLRRGTVLALLAGFWLLWANQLLNHGALPGPVAALAGHRAFHNQATFLLMGDWAPYPRLVTHFLAGAALYLWREKVPYAAGLAAAAGGGIVALAALGAGLSLAFPLLGGYLALWAGFHPTRPGEALTKRGDLSYGIYLYAWPVQQLTVHFWGRPPGPWMLFLIALPLTIALALLSWRLVEAPALRCKSV